MIRSFYSINNDSAVYMTCHKSDSIIYSIRGNKVSEVNVRQNLEDYGFKNLSVFYQNSKKQTFYYALSNSETLNTDISKRYNLLSFKDTMKIQLAMSMLTDKMNKLLLFVRHY